MIVGIDEVGRGPWAGPMVFGAVVLGGAIIEGLTDSKKLTKKRREILDSEIREKALAYGLGWVSNEELDEVGMSRACELACRRALEQITVPYSEIIIDGTVNFLKNTGKGPYVTTMKQADLFVPSVSAASILAKVARDRFMEEQDTLFPEYGFKSHVGYGTKQHQEALHSFGVTSLHRKSFAPIAKVLGTVSHTEFKAKSIKVTTRAIGNVSEDVAAQYLVQQKFRVIERNWRTKACEIDIVAEKDGVWYFVEVKHRRTDYQGGGLAAITAKKLKQMKLAARMYTHFHQLVDVEMRTAVLVTIGAQMAVTQLLVID